MQGFGRAHTETMPLNNDLVHCLSDVDPYHESAMYMWALALKARPGAGARRRGCGCGCGCGWLEEVPNSITQRELIFALSVPSEGYLRSLRLCCTTKTHHQKRVRERTFHIPPSGRHQGSK